MADDVITPNFKQHKFTPHRFTSTNQPRRGASQEAARAKASVKEALMNAFDKLGNEAFFVDLGRGSAEDKRCLAMILAKLLPIEVAGALDSTLTVRVVSMIGESELDITPLPKDATPHQVLPVAPGAGRDPEDGRG